MTETTLDPAVAEQPPARASDPLAPLRAALLRSARRDADADTGAAEAERRRVLAEAHAEAERIRAQARAEGERDAEQLRLDQRARSRRRARATVLAEQSRALDALRREVGRRLVEMWRDPDRHDALRQRLVVVARADLGDEAVVTEVPDGGIVATTPRARATYRLTDLGDEAIASLDTDLDGLWTP